MTRSAMIVLGASAGLLFLLALCGVALVAADLLGAGADQTQAATADARLGASARCSALVIIGGCGVTAAQAQAQQQAQPPAVQPASIGLALLGGCGIALLLGMGLLRLLAR